MLPSNSEQSPQPSSGFQQLHPGVQRWIWKQGWSTLRPIQEQTIPLILSREQDVIISAATAGGKTEAAFLPIFSYLANEPATGIQTLCISPLKALINDQHRRLETIGDALDIPVTPWHGDIDAGRKHRLLKQPSGILLITPESLEALLIRHGTGLSDLFQVLSYIVVDELHAFIGSERGKQLQSLMHRIEQVIRRRVPRIGLSATLGDMSLAAQFLRPGKSDQVELVISDDEGQEIKIQVRGYHQTEPNLNKETNLDAETEEDGSNDEIDIAVHLFKVLRGDTNLIFINARANVEAYADRLRRLCEQQRLPNEFWPHHGSLSKDIREEAETALKSGKPANVVCTTTLEMGIDIGSVKSIAQVGPPFSVSSTRQRLGRSGRKEGDPAIIRFYISEPEVTLDTSPQDSLRLKLVQTIAIINLMVFERWCEPPVVNKLHLSTLIQQVLSLIAQYGGAQAIQIWQVLCKTGAFYPIDQQMFTQLLRQLGEHDLIQQTHDGLLILGLKGERLVNHYSFYTAFKTPEEYRITTSGRTLGTLPIDFPIVEGMFLIFAGRRWKVRSVNPDQKVVDVTRSAAGRVPKFSGSGGGMHDKIRQEMYRIYISDDIPPFLDRTAQELLQEARQNFFRLRLHTNHLLKSGNQVLLFSWMGSKVVNTLYLMLLAQNLSVSTDGITVSVQDISIKALQQHLHYFLEKNPFTGISLSGVVKDKVLEKHDIFLGEELLCWNYAASYLDTQGALETLQKIVQ
ncbi:MAG: DEAD/DEAH box helicase [Cyanobacteria bacterium P01_D01_bin.56]